MTLGVLTVAGCAGNATGESRIASPAAGREIAVPETGRGPSASVSLVGFTCRAGEEFKSRNELALYPEFRAMKFRCDGEASSRFIDEAGRIGSQLPAFWGIPGAAPDDTLDGAYAAGGRRWAALVSSSDERGRETRPKIHFLVQDSEGAVWTPISARDEGGWPIVSLGPWPGGAILATLAEWADHRNVELQVVQGKATAPLPRLEEQVGQPFDFLTTPEGRAYAVWNVDSPEGGVETRSWDAARLEWREQLISGISLSKSSGVSLVAAGPQDVYFAGDTMYDSRQKRVVTVVRFDGTQWVTSCTIADARDPDSLIVTPDGAAWVIVDLQGPEIPAGRFEIWRRRPGSADVWDQIAPDVVGRHTTLSAFGLIPAGDHDVYFGGGLEGQGGSIACISRVCDTKPGRKARPRHGLPNPQAPRRLSMALKIMPMPLQIEVGKKHAARGPAKRRYDRAGAMRHAKWFWNKQCCDGYVAIHKRGAPPYREAEPEREFENPGRRDTEIGRETNGTPIPWSDLDDCSHFTSCCIGRPYDAAKLRPMLRENPHLKREDAPRVEAG